LAAQGTFTRHLLPGAGADVIPADADAIPAGTDVIPADADAIPAGNVAIPAGNGVMDRAAATAWNAAGGLPPVLLGCGRCPVRGPGRW